MKTYNLKESLIQMDKETDFKYTLTDLYEACQLDEKKKAQLAQYIDAKDPVGMNAMLCNEANVMIENVSDDLSDDEMPDGVVAEGWGPDLTDCPACGDISFDSKKGKCTRCSYKESLEEAFEEGDMVYVKPSKKSGRVVRVKGDIVEVEIMGGKDPDRRDTFYTSDLEMEKPLNESDEELDFSCYNLTDEQIEKVKYIRQHLNTPEGYRAYYELEKEITDEGGCMDIFYDLSADFAWDNRFSVAITRLALADNRPDLADPNYLPGGCYAEYMDDPKYANVLLEDVNGQHLEATLRAAAETKLAEMGYEGDFIDEYFGIKLEDTDDNRVKVTVWGELSYEESSELADVLNYIVAEEDPDAYFDHETSGRMAAYIRKDQSEDIPDEALVSEWSDKFNGCTSWEELKAVYGEFYNIRDDLNNGTHRALYDIIDKKIDELKPVEEALKENYGEDEVSELMSFIQDYDNGSKWDDFVIEFDGIDDENLDPSDIVAWISRDDDFYNAYLGAFSDDEFEESLTEAFDSDIPAPYNKYYEIGINREDIPEEDIPDAFDNYKGMNLLAIVYAKEQYEDALGDNCLDYCYLVEDDQGKMIVTTAGPRVYAVELDEIERCIGDNIEEALTEDAGTISEKDVISQLRSKFKDSDWKLRISKDKQYVMVTSYEDDYCTITPMSKIIDALNGVESFDDVDLFDIIDDEAIEKAYVHHAFEESDYIAKKKQFLVKYFGKPETSPKSTATKSSNTTSITEDTEGAPAAIYSMLDASDKYVDNDEYPEGASEEEIIEIAKNNPDCMKVTKWVDGQTGPDEVVWERPVDIWFVSQYEGGAEYEHAEGGYYYETLTHVDKETFDSKEAARKRLAELADEARKEGQDVVAQNDDFFRIKTGRYIGDCEEYHVEAKEGAHASGKQVYEGLNESILREMNSPEEKPYSAAEIEKEIKSLTQNFTRKKDNLKCGFKEENDAAIKLLKKYYNKVTSEKHGQWFEITFSEPKKELKEDVQNTPVKLASEYFYDNIKNVQDAGWSDVLSFAEDSGWISGSNIIIPAGTVMTLVDQNRYFDVYWVKTNAGDEFIPFNKDFTAESPLPFESTEGLNNYRVTFYMDSLDDNVMSGPSTTKMIRASSEEEAKKKLIDSSTDKYYIPTVTKVELVESVETSKEWEHKDKDGKIGRIRQSDGKGDRKPLTRDQAKELAKFRGHEDDELYSVNESVVDLSKAKDAETQSFSMASGDFVRLGKADIDNEELAKQLKSQGYVMHRDIEFASGRDIMYVKESLTEGMTYTDTNGFLGEPGETYTMSQFRRMWQDKDNDPVMSGYDSFEEWVGETISQMDAHEEVAPSGRGMASCKIWKDTNGVMGTPGGEYTLNDLADYWTNNKGSDPVLAEYKGDWKAWLDATIPQMEERIDDSLYCEDLESKTFTDKEEAKKFAKDNKGAITSVVDDKLNPTHYVHYKGKKEPVKESFEDMLKDPEVQRRNAEYADKMKAKHDKENELAREAKNWPDDKVLTYEEALALAKAYYTQGGDGFYETIEKYQFDDEVKMFGPMTVRQMKRDFGVFDSVAKDRMSEGADLNETVEKYELLIEPYKRYEQAPLVKKVFNTDSLAKVLEHIANKWMYGFDPIERAADEGWECETREEAIEALQKEYDKAYTQILIDELEGCNGDGCGFIFYLKNLTTGDMIIDSGIEPEEEEEDLFESAEEASDDYTLSIWNDDELVKDNVWSVSDALEFIHDNGGNTIKVTDHEGERIVWKDGKAVGGGFIGKDIDEYGVTSYFEDGEDVPTHKGAEPFNAWEWMYGKQVDESFKTGDRVKQTYANPYNVGKIINSKQTPEEGNMFQVKWDYSDGADIEWVNAGDISPYNEDDEKAGHYE